MFSPLSTAEIEGDDMPVFAGGRVGVEVQRLEADALVALSERVFRAATSVTVKSNRSR
jgi:hypothetical protein